MSDADVESTYTYLGMRDKVVPDLPDNAVKEHLSIVNCGHDVGSGRSAMEGQKETFQEMTGTDGELTQRVVENSRANSTSNNEIDLWMKVYEQDYPRILRLHDYFLEIWPTITIELVNPIIATVGNDSRSVGSELTIFVEVVKELGSMQGVIDQGQTIRVLHVFPTGTLKWMLSNTTKTRDHGKSVLPVAIPPVPCQACPRTQTTFPHKWQIRTAHQSNEKKFICGDYTTEFVNEYIFEFATEVLEETSNENEENYMMIYVKMINRKTISIKCEGKQIATILFDEVERRSLIPRDMTYLAHQGKVMNEKKTMEENNIEPEATLVMSLRLLGGMENNEQMDTHATEEDREKKRKLEDGKEGKMMKPNDDTVFLRRDIMEALKRPDQKMESYSRKADEKMENFSRKADEMMEKFLQITSSVGNQI